MQLLSIYRGYTCTHLTTFIMLAGFAGKQFEHLVSPVGVCTVTYKHKVEYKQKLKEP